MDYAKRPTITIVPDQRLPAERTHLLTRTINLLRQYAQVQLLSGDITEEEVLEKIQGKPPHLLLAPWYRYLAWDKLESHFGLTRTTGPTFAGYFADKVLTYEMEERPERNRAILLDFANLLPKEAFLLVRSLTEETHRTGIRAFLEETTPIYCEPWMQSQGLGLRVDTVLSLPEIAQSEWIKRANALRVCLIALWSHIYEEGPGKADAGPVAASKGPRAYFQVAAGTKCLALRLCYMAPGTSSKNTLANFWPDDKRPSSPAQLLQRYCDFVRVETFPENSGIELVCGFLPSAISEQTSGQLHALWIDSVSEKLVHEIPTDAPGTDPRLKALPNTLPADSRGALDEEKAQARERALLHAANTLRELKKSLAEKDEIIRELKSGGVGSAKPLAPPDAEALLDAFQQRYFDAKFQIHQLEVQIQETEARGATPALIEAIRQKIAVLTQREKLWIKKIATTLETCKKIKNPENQGER